jgi:hypothetical protein
LRSAQAALGIPSYRRRLGDEAPPEYRLSHLAPGSTTVGLVSVDDRQVSVDAVTRHLDGLDDFIRTGQWPRHMYPGERQAWADVYGSLFRGDLGASALVSVNGGEARRVDTAVREELAREPITPAYEEVQVVGSLHLIEVEVSPRFKIRTEDVDLSFELTAEIQPEVDGLRWRRVRARALWEVGSNRAKLIGSLELSADPAGVVTTRQIEVPKWISVEATRISDLARLPDGWGGSESKRVKPSMVERANELVRRIFESFPELVSVGSYPHFGPNLDGNIEFEWQVQDRFLNGEILPTGFDLLVVQGKEDLYEGTVSHKQLFEWISWLLTGHRADRG